MIENCLRSFPCLIRSKDSLHKVQGNNKQEVDPNLKGLQPTHLLHLPAKELTQETMELMVAQQPEVDSD